MSARDRLQSDRLRAALGQATIGRHIILLEETGSTNDVVREMAGGDWPDGVVVFAEHQTAGRGQRGHTWESAAFKGLCCSVLLRPAIRIDQATTLTTWAAQSVSLVMECTCGLKPTIKLPNDVYLNRRKVAGILVEMIAQPRAPHAAILGIGINVNQTGADFPLHLRDTATSIAIEARCRQDRNALAIALLQQLDRTYHSAVLAISIGPEAPAGHRESNKELS
jgi:BirA family transcriptional regulator, biotin operon repressor / biotin---[acetyl-CoA-carboxylase] ligase